MTTNIVIAMIIMVNIPADVVWLGAQIANFKPPLRHS